MAGWIKIYRDIQEHWIWQDANKLKWWLDIILMANHKDNKFLLGNELFEVKRGEFHTSELKLAERWNVSKKSVRSFLELLERDHMVELNKSKKGTTIKVSNYEDYQSNSEEEKTTKKPQKNHNVDNKNTIEEPQKNHNVDTNKNDKEYIKNDKEREEGKEGKEEVPSLPPLFFSTPIHKKIYDQFGEVGYRTFFMEAEIKELDKEIIITHQDNFIENMILDRWVGKLKFLLGKKITVGEE